jgi:hypothetical protein
MCCHDASGAAAAVLMTRVRAMMPTTTAGLVLVVGVTARAATMIA